MTDPAVHYPSMFIELAHTLRSARGDGGWWRNGRSSSSPNARRAISRPTIRAQAPSASTDKRCRPHRHLDLRPRPGEDLREHAADAGLGSDKAETGEGLRLPGEQVPLPRIRHRPRTRPTRSARGLKLGCRTPSSARYPPTLSCVTTFRSGSACTEAPSRSPISYVGSTRTTATSTSCTRRFIRRSTMGRRRPAPAALRHADGHDR